MVKAKTSSKAKGPSQRQLRVAEQIRHLIASSLRSGHFRDPDLLHTENITVTSVDVSPDLQNANAFVIPLGGTNSDIIIKALNRASGFFRKEIGAELDLRYAPRISFKMDKSFDEAQHINNILIKERSRIKSSEEDASEDNDEQE